jgi:Ca-activated chloride channel family protein
VLLSDGPDEGATHEARAAMLTAVVPPGPDREVRIFTIAYGDQAETDTLASLAEASLGTAYEALDPADIGKVFSQVVANF